MKPIKTGRLSLENIVRRNVSGIDRLLRIGAGVTLVAVGAWGWIGLVPLLTGPWASVRCTR